LYARFYWLRRSPISFFFLSSKKKCPLDFFSKVFENERERILIDEELSSNDSNFTLTPESSLPLEVLLKKWVIEGV